MSIDYSASGGVGFKITRDMLLESKTLKESDIEKFDDSPSDFFDDLLKASCISYQEYGNSYSGDVNYMAVMSNANTLKEAIDNSDQFLKEFNERFGLNKQLCEIEIISEGHLW